MAGEFWPWPTSFDSVESMDTLTLAQQFVELPSTLRLALSNARLPHCPNDRCITYCRIRVSCTCGMRKFTELATGNGCS